MRLKWPPPSLREIAAALHTSITVVQQDIEYIMRELGPNFWGASSMTRAARVVAEMEVLALKLLDEADKLTPVRAFAPERAALYSKAMQALMERNRIMAETGMIAKAPVQVDIHQTGGAQSVTAMTVEARIAALADQAETVHSLQAAPVAPTEVGALPGKTSP